MKRHRSIASMVVLSLALAARALAGGPQQKPDGIGNPSGNDYTGYTSQYLVLDVRENTDQRTVFSCYNPGKNAGDWAVQLWDTADVSGRDPRGDCADGDLPLGDVDSIFSSSMAGDPMIGNRGVAKIIAIGEGGKGKPKLLCRAAVEDKMTGEVVAVLAVIPITGKEAKPKETK